MNDVRCKFYHNFIQDNSSSQRHLFSAAKKLLNQGDNRVVYPPVDDNINLVNQLGTFFIQKIETIGSNLDNMAQGLPALPDDHASVSPSPPLQIHPSYGREGLQAHQQQNKEKLHSRPYAGIPSDRLHQRAYRS